MPDPVAGSPLKIEEKPPAGIFSIRRIGSVYYPVNALNRAEFGIPNHLWALLGFNVLLTIPLHGTTVTPIVRLVDRRQPQRRDLP